MPAIRPTYNSESEIPAELKPYYKQNGSVWEVWDEGEAVAKYFNTGLAQNRDALKVEKEQQKARADSAEARANQLTTEKTTLETQVTSKVTEATTPLNNRINELQTELNTVKAPGSVVLSADKAAALAEYEKLGTPADVTKLVKEELPAAKGEVSQFKKAESFRKVARDVFGSETAADVLTDIMQLPRNSGLEIRMKKVKTTVKGVNGAADEEKMIDTPHVFQKVAKEGGGEEEVWTPLKEYADTNWKTYLPALQATEDGKENGGGGDQTRRTTMPQQRASGGSDQGGKVDAKKIFETSNAARDNAYNPLTNPNPQAKANANAT